MNMVIRATAVAATPSIALANMDDDQVLLDLEREIMDAHAKATINDDEISRLQEIWRDELLRLDASGESREDISAIIRNMPEAIEQNRLNGLAQPHFDQMDELIAEMWAIPARTQKGRRAKLSVLLTCVMAATWLDSDEDADYDARLARQLMVEMLGGDEGTKIRNLYSAPIAV